MTPKSVTVVVVTWRSSRTIGRCLEALRPLHAEGTIDAVVVDNASDDGTAELVRNQHPWVTLVESGGNLGFGRACNLGLAEASTPYVLFLNPDARIAGAELAKLVAFLEANPRAGIAGPAIDNGGGEPQPILPFLTPAGLVAGAFGRGVPARAIVPGTAPERVDWVCGAALLIRTALARELRGFDERFFLYFEEMDLCKRARDLGHEVWAVGEAQADHAWATSAKQTGKRLHDGCVAEHYFRSRAYYLRKHHGAVAAGAARLVAGLRGR